MSVHTHDDIDWAAKLESLRRFDSVDNQALRTVADRLGVVVPSGGTVVDLGSGAGGMSAEFARVLSAAGGGRLVLVDAVPELLEAASGAAYSAIEGPGEVSIDTVLADVDSSRLGESVPDADLLWASGVLHHLPDQQAALDRFAGLVRVGGLLAIVEDGLETRCLPWDIGIGEPGLEQRIAAARGVWFRDLRRGIDDSVRMPYGWARGLGAAGLTSVGSFSYLVDHPAPPTSMIRDYVVERCNSAAAMLAEYLSDEDRGTLRRLLDEQDSEYVGAREDIYLLTARTVHYGWRS